MTTFRSDLADLINRHSMENRSNTPDFILAEFLGRQLEVFDAVVVERDRWYGISPAPGWRAEVKHLPAPYASGLDEFSVLGQSGTEIIAERIVSVGDVSVDTLANELISSGVVQLSGQASVSRLADVIQQIVTGKH